MKEKENITSIVHHNYDVYHTAQYADEYCINNINNI